MFDFVGRGITTIGTVPSGLPPIGLPAIDAGQSLADMGALLPTVLSMFVLILAQSAATSRAYAMKYDDRFDENVDLVGLGVGNLAAGMSGTFVVNGSPTKTQMVDGAGGRSQIAQLTTAAIVVVVLLFLTVPLSYMPNAVLAAVVFLIGLKLVDRLGMASIYSGSAGRVRGRARHGGDRRHGRRGAGHHPRHRAVAGPRGDARVQASRPGRPPSRPTARACSGRSEERVQAAPGLVIYAFGAELFYANTTRSGDCDRAPASVGSELAHARGTGPDARGDGRPAPLTARFSESERGSGAAGPER